MIDIPAYIRYAKVSQVKDTVKIANQNAFQGGTTVPDYTRLLEIVRKSVEFMYVNNPGNSTLTSVANYMYNLSGKRSVTPTAPISVFLIIVQPTSQTVDTGDDVTFSVVVAGGTQPYSYQWYFNDAILTGETDLTLDLTDVDSGDAGAYTVIIMDANGQTLTSEDAVLIVNAVALTGSFWYGDTDYFAALSSGTDAVPYQGTFPITHNASLVVPYTVAAGDNKMLVIRVPVGESLKSNWVNTAFNFGTIQPSDGIFRVPLNPAGLPLYTYYLTELASSFDFNSPNTLTLS